MNQRKPNKLINEKSLYLKQHAYNPINWYPWSEEAFRIAEERDCPIFLSIGYSSCHWCHVMERESFEDEEVAKILNENFVSIKVDREEHPDVDNFYMTFVQSSIGSGGWPLSVFLLPDKTPFFGGTYFPPEPKFGKPSFKNVLISVIETYRNRRNDLEKMKYEIQSFLEKIFVVQEKVEKVDIENLKDVFTTISNAYDWSNGGWGKGSKFPMFTLLNFLIDYFNVFNDNTSLAIVEHNITKILTGGIYDHLEGGMHRYTVDNKWIVPHYEKMLYDNAQLIELISKFLILKDDEFFKSKLYETFYFLKREMKDDSGGYLTAIDADSENEEGKFYLWNYNELVSEIKIKFNSDLFFEFYQFNLVEKESLKGNLSIKKIPNENDVITINELNLIKEHLRKIRALRPKPEKDNKILTDLNSLLISALCWAYRATENQEFINEAKSIHQFICSKLVVENNLYHSFTEGEARISGFAEDYFSLIQAKIDLYETTFEDIYLLDAYDLLKNAINQFYDEKNKAIYQQTANSNLPFRTTENKDYSKPSSTSLAISVALKLGKIFEDNELLKIGNELIEKNFDELNKYPFGGGKFFSGVCQFVVPSKEIILVEGTEDGNFKGFKSFMLKQIHPSLVVLVKKKETPFKFSYLFGKESLNGKATLYICENFSCKKPITEISDLMFN
ncbi:MAG: thioredoxin domain-containing protein [Ignavibacteria bacterium]|nr:thioredoxin domain-containing protein [Ignavibacteria bacterium]